GGDGRLAHRGAEGGMDKAVAANDDRASTAIPVPERNRLRTPAPGVATMQPGVIVAHTGGARTGLAGGDPANARVGNVRDGCPTALGQFANDLAQVVDERFPNLDRRENIGRHGLYAVCE